MDAARIRFLELCPEGTDRMTENRKAELLSSPVEHIDITKFDARPVVDAWEKMSFTSRDAVYQHQRF